MLTFLALQAVLEPVDTGPVTQPTSSSLSGHGLREVLLVLGLAMVLGLLLFVWAYLAHKGRRRHHHHSRPSQPSPRPEGKSPELSSARRMRPRRRRRNHPDNLPRNPTLGETGGLPPIRPEEPPPEVAQQ